MRAFRTLAAFRLCRQPTIAKTTFRPITNFARPSQTLRSPLSTYSSSFRAAFRRSKPTWQQQRPFSRSTQYRRRQAFNYQTFQGTKNLFARWAARPTFYYELGGITFVCATFYVYNLEQVPVSNRYRFNVIKPDWEQAMGEQMYQQTMQEFGGKLMSNWSKEHRMVQRVLDRLIPASGLQGEEWEVHVIDDPMKNAFVIPGGKVFVFRGILDVAQGEDGLAAVLGHEIAHNVAHHAAERMSQAFIFLPVALIGTALLGVDPGIGRYAVDLAFTLPGSRTQESEADYIGLMMMSESCFDPHAAMGLWSRMEKEEQGTPPQFLSTHPSSHNRLEKISEWLPKAQQKLEASECGMLGGYASDFRRQVPEFSRW